MTDQAGSAWEALRRRAEERLGGEGGTGEGELQRLLHELQVHRLELEMQNEALIQSRAALQASLSRYADLYERSPVGYLTLARDGRIIDLNPAGRALLGRGRDDPRGRPFASFLAGEEAGPWHLFLAGLIAEEGGNGAHFRMAVGAPRQVLVQGLSVRNDDGSLAVHVGLTDITALEEARQAQKAAREAAEDSSRAKTLFLANMSHEMRTPLSLIIGLGELLGKELIHPGQRRRLGQIREYSEHLLALINDILDLSRIESGGLTIEPGLFEFAGVIAEIERLFRDRAREKGLSLTIDVPSALRRLPLRGDSRRLSQVLINLLENAFKFTDRGSVTLGIACIGEAPGSIRLRFSVIDSGCGIAPADQSVIFEPFRQLDGTMTRRHGGSGLGLAISQSLVSLMGGVIRVDSNEGSGSRFHFELVLSNASGPASPSGPVARGPREDLSGASLRHALIRLPGMETDPAWLGSTAQMLRHCFRLKAFVTRYRGGLQALLEAGDREGARALKREAEEFGIRRIAFLADEIDQGLGGGASGQVLDYLVRECQSDLEQLDEALNALPADGRESPEEEPGHSAITGR